MELNEFMYDYYRNLTAELALQLFDADIPTLNFQQAMTLSKSARGILPLELRFVRKIIAARNLSMVEGLPRETAIFSRKNSGFDFDTAAKTAEELGDFKKWEFYLAGIRSRDEAIGQYSVLGDEYSIRRAREHIEELREKIAKHLRQTGREATYRAEKMKVVTGIDFDAKLDEEINGNR